MSFLALTNNRCFIKSDRAGLIIDTPKIFALKANIDGPCNSIISTSLLHVPYNATENTQLVFKHRFVTYKYGFLFNSML